ncbi:5-carboxymethyl-2-hydroxymuconate isomerase [Hydrogenophaga sp.]|uniref:5-carboxymethyl-2-hydroxymuconate isomerase n=1 Tax=Hydrogenophaga sp. TaxID=1904254 RepID=UPI002718BD7F|nr:5-carboxymethyl-2-hydroxymuconate isomerase [Hydrogenophaga sp.]MDO9437240.1 5-carboxymethyl-2-hydroxymuconate isomerase [Hydrogenophaga sp.]
MPHLVIQHTPNIDTDFQLLARTLLKTILSIRDKEGQQVFPEGGTRVMTFKADTASVGDGEGDYGFIFLNLRIVAGRDPEVVKATGERLLEAVKAHVEPVFGKPAMGVTLNIEETPKQLPGPTMLVYEGFHNGLRAIFGR